MEAYTYQELRKLASEKKIRGRSKLKTKADLWEALNSLTDDFGKLNIQRKTTTIEDYLVSGIEDMNIEDAEDVGSSSYEINDDSSSTLAAPSTTTDIYRYAVVQCPYIRDAFPVLGHEDPSDETSPLKWNDFMYHFFGHKNKYDGVWVSTKSDVGGPIGFKSDINVPMDVYFEEYTDGSHIGDENVKSMTLYPYTDSEPREIGYDDLLEKYGKYCPADHSYYIKEAVEFCKELIKRSEKWNYLPGFVKDLEDIFSENGRNFDNKIVFVDVAKDDMEDFQRTVLEYPVYENCHFTEIQEFYNSSDELCAFFMMEEK